METKTNIQKIYDYLKNHQDLKDFDFKIDEYENLEITDKRTLDPNCTQKILSFEFIKI